MVVEPVTEQALSDNQREAVDALIEETHGDLVAVVDTYLLGDKERENVNPDDIFKIRFDAKDLRGYDPSTIKVYLVQDDGTLVEVEFEIDEDGSIIISHGKLGYYIIVRA